MAEDVGTVVAGRYRLVRLLGEGGMGSAWQAVDERLRRDVAIKQLRLPHGIRSEARGQLVARVEREAQAAGRLRHPGIITVHDLLTDERGLPWIVMELVAGASLDQIVEEGGRLSPEWTARIGAQVASALAAAHAAGIVHRDVKPANILLEGDRVVLTDFGIASLEGDTTLTPTGLMIGTPAYMAPEQIDGAAATAASDMWALGATLYKAVEGRPPFEAPTPAALLMSVNRGKPAPMTHAGPLHPLLRALLSKNPASRPTAATAAASLTELTTPAEPTRPIRRDRTGEPARTLPPVRRPAQPLMRRPVVTRRRVLLGLGAAAVLTAVPTTYLLTRRTGPDWSTPAPLAADFPGHSSTITSLVFTSDGKTMISASADDVVRWWNVLDGKPVGRPFTTGAGPTPKLLLSPQGTVLAVNGVIPATSDTSEKHSLRLWTPDRRLIGDLTLEDSGDYARRMAFSADGKRLAVFHNYDFQLRVYDTATRERLIGFPRKGNDADALAYSPDGKLLASASRLGDVSELQLWDISSATPIDPPVKHPSLITALAFDPKGRVLVSGDDDSIVSLWDPATVTAITKLPRRHAAPVQAIAFTPDGSVLATGATGVVCLWDMTSRRLIGNPLPHPGTVSSLMFHPNGDLLATGGTDGKIRLWQP
ncbi:serine/threonine protein kinase [Sphaerisporangium rubeum]|uniref:Serine/threonine protein kinase n=1 Tax=Sphaerisporangium rubeum TaxID=321317 RepID=A0A7X0IHF5_9ACTN|nr:serine/threonine protein kinase [Sphaerisporangium rubeum]